MLRLIIQGKIEGKRGRGRSWITWIQNLKEWLDNSWTISGHRRKRVLWNIVIANVHWGYDIWKKKIGILTTGNIIITIINFIINYINIIIVPEYTT